MDEAKRVIRYTLPGLVFVLLLGISFIILNPEIAKDFFIEDKLEFSKLITVFIVSGSLGYVFSIIYFGIYWILSFWGLHIFNHLTLVKALVDSNKLKIVEPSNFNKVKISGRRQAWHIVNVYWHSRKKTSDAIAGVSEKLEPYYSDITTALGSTFIAAIFSFMTFYICLDTYFDKFQDRVFWINVMYLAIIFIIGLNYRNTYLSYQRLVNLTIATEITEEYEKKKSPIIIVYYK